MRTRTHLVKLRHRLVVRAPGRGPVRLSDDELGRAPSCLGILQDDFASVLKPVVVAEGACVVCA